MAFRSFCRCLLLAGGWLLHTSLPAQAQAGPNCTVFVVGGTGAGAASQLAQTLAAVCAQAAPLGSRSTLVVLETA